MEEVIQHEIEINKINKKRFPQLSKNKIKGLSLNFEEEINSIINDIKDNIKFIIIITNKKIKKNF